MRDTIKKITHPFLKLGLQLYYYKPRTYCYDGICVKVHPDVFPPHLTLSTKILLDFINQIDLNNKSFLELGCGSGIISLLAKKKGAFVTASDINKTALKYLEAASLKNNLAINCIYSNMFDNIEQQSFDYIVINPPYYPKQPKSIKEKAWFCGENFEYFETLFKQIGSFKKPMTQIIMILSEDCDIKTIKAIAKKNKLALFVLEKKKQLFETNFIYKIGT